MNPVKILIEALVEVAAIYIVPYPPPLSAQTHRKFAELPSNHKQLLFAVAEAKAKKQFSYEYKQKYYDLMKEIVITPISLSPEEIELWIDDYAIWLNRNGIYC